MFQKRLDDARDTVDKGGVSAKALDELGAALERDMPQAVREKLSGHAPGHEITRIPLDDVSRDSPSGDLTRSRFKPVAPEPALR